MSISNLPKTAKKRENNHSPQLGNLKGVSSEIQGAGPWGKAQADSFCGRAQCNSRCSWK